MKDAIAYSCSCRIVAGGGTALVNVIPAVADLELTGDETTCRNDPLRALEEPVRPSPCAG